MVKGEIVVKQANLAKMALGCFVTKNVSSF
jgi:hypothetical protein